MGIIIKFDPSRRVSKTSNVKPQRPLFIKKDDKKDSFSKKNDEPKTSYSLEEMIETVGIERVDEIFNTYLDREDTKNLTGIISPDESGSRPLGETLRNIFDNSEESEKLRRAKIREISRTQKAFRTLEVECSKKHEEIYGEKKDIRIKIKKGDDECYLVDELQRQQDFYKKGRIKASMDAIKRRIEYKKSQK